MAGSSLEDGLRPASSPSALRRPISISGIGSGGLPGYRDVIELHRGSRSVVLGAVRTDDDTEVALKALSPECADRGARARLMREHLVLRALDCSGVARARSLVGTSLGLTLEVERAPGEPLFATMALGPMAMGRFLDLATKLVAAVAAIHARGVIHRDLSPANVLYDLGTGAVTVIDFGGASLLGDAHASGLEGTLGYLAPEQTGRLKRPIDRRSDLFSLGVIFHELLTGRPLHATRDPLEILHATIAQVPTPVADLRGDVPILVSDVIAKLLAKSAVERYQSDEGLASDLAECVRRWRAAPDKTDGGPSSRFELGLADQVEAFAVPDKLYGRAPQRALLADAVTGARAAAPNAVLILGPGGVGKTALIDEVRRAHVAASGRVASAKFDQLRRAQPYAPILPMLRSLVRTTCAEGDEATELLKARLHSIGPDVALLAEAIPDIAALVGSLPARPVLPLAEAQNRFVRALAATFEAFSNPRDPGARDSGRLEGDASEPLKPAAARLALFLDDLQWIDSASLALVERLLVSRQAFLVLGYRDADVGPSHPLAEVLARIPAGTVSRVEVGPLAPGDVAELLRDALGADPDEAAALARVIHEKTGGNAFFVRELLIALRDRGKIRRDGARWALRVDDVASLAITDNVADLLSARLGELPAETREMVGVAACVGNRFDLARLAGAAGVSEAEAARAIWPAVAAGLLVASGNVGDVSPASGADDPPLASDIQFAHDRVQEAASAVLPEERKQRAHLAVGRLLAPHVGDDLERVFEVVDHLDAGLTLLEERADRRSVAALNLRAGRGAATAAAFGAALTYFEVGVGLLDEAAWRDEYDLALGLHLGAAESMLLCGDRVAGVDYVGVALARATTVVDRVAAAEIRIKKHIARREYAEAVDGILAALRWLSVQMPSRPSLLDVGAAIAHARWRLRAGALAGLRALPETSDPHAVAAMRLLTTAATVSYYVSTNLVVLVFLRIAELSIDRGLTRYSAYGFAGYAFLLAALFDDVPGGERYGTFARELVDRFDASELRAKIEVSQIGFVELRMLPMRHGIEPFLAAQRAALFAGDAEFAALGAFNHAHTSLLAGVDLDAVDGVLGRAIDECRRLGQAWPLNACLLIRQLVANLRGEARDPSVLDGRYIKLDEYVANARKAGDKAGLATLAIYQMLVSYLFARPAEAVRHAESALANAKAVPGAPQLGLMHLYSALSRLALAREASRVERVRLTLGARANIAALKKRAIHGRVNFFHQQRLAEAELAAVEGRDLEAIAAFDEAIAGARSGDFSQEVALALELAARFYLSRGRERSASVYFAEARAAWSQWGATARVARLDADRLTSVRAVTRTGSTPASTEGSLTNMAVDLESVMKAARAISGELNVERLLQRLTVVILENAGAERGALILDHDGELCLSARGSVGREGTTVDVPAKPLPLLASGASPHAIAVIRYVALAGEHVVVDDLHDDERFARAAASVLGPCSIACVPLVQSQRLVGVVYLENGLTTGAFPPERVELLELLSAQAILSLENARLYAKLEQHSRSLERTVEERTHDLQDKNVELAQTLKELHATQAQLVTQEKLASLGALTAGIAHEVKNPLNFVTNFADVTAELALELTSELEAKRTSIDRHALESLLEVASAIRENATRIEEHGRRAARVVDRMTLHARHAPSDRARGDLNGVVADGVRLAVYAGRTRFRGHDVKVVADYDPQVGEVDMVAANLQRVFINVIDNAIYATWKKRQTADASYAPTITVRTRALGRRVEISVRDNGVGAPPNVIERVFEPFFTTKPTGEGTGLGLSISHDIVVQGHQGSLRLASIEGESTEVLLMLPRPEDALTPRPE